MRARKSIDRSSVIAQLDQTPAPVSNHLRVTLHFMIIQETIILDCVTQAVNTKLDNNDIVSIDYFQTLQPISDNFTVDIVTIVTRTTFKYQINRNSISISVMDL